MTTALLHEVDGLRTLVLVREQGEEAAGTWSRGT
jgi:hypothetical protein